MKAIVCTQYGPPDVLQFKDAAKPAPKDNEVLIKIRAASLNPLDWHFMRGEPRFVRLISGLHKPKRTILGSDIAGRVEAVGSLVKQFQPGDEVFGGLGLGGFAEYACAREDKLALKPANTSFEDAAAIPIAAITALQGLRKGRIRPGQKVLVDGASGGVGTFAVQIAKSFGAEVTAVCSTRNVDIARSIGADHVIDYSREDFTKNAQQYDLILAANAFHSIFDYRRALNRDGICVKTGGGSTRIPSILTSLVLETSLSLTGRKKIGGLLAHINNKDLVFLKDLFEAGKVASIIDRRYPLSAAPEAIRYLEEGHAQGKVVLTVGQE
jgi:NADPH:quinone reductase-like Zn-dependent oxidoreductase